ncbi:CDP-glycerol glycerophosphotransferase family protein [Stenotrophomonas sp.]|uniref:CDP-glycerol glycerophosphotransferase family protein n=1 Tax=Stenotrophomonas sp. TaxID=69392 RepID=UPI003341572A
MAAESFSFMRDNLRKASKLPWLLLLAARAKFASRDPKLWVIGRRSGVGDGPLALAIEAKSVDPAIRIVWLTRDSSDDQLAQRHGLQYVRRDSKAALQLCLRAGVGVMTNGFSDLRGPAIWGATTVQLWHGAPLKRIGQDRIEPLGAHRSFIRKASSAFEKFWNQHYRYIIAGSETTAGRLASAMAARGGTAVATGDPRMDLIPRGAVTARLTLDALASGHGIEGRKYVLIAPTWRDGGEPMVLPDQASRDLIANDDRIVIFVRAHPHSADIRSLFDMKNVIALSSDDFPDITSMLGAFDVLMTDYSSIAMDFAPLERPIIFAAPDLESYTASPGLYEEYELFTGGHWHQTWTAAFRCLHDLHDDEAMRDKLVDISKAIGSRYHPMGMTGNASRVLMLIRDVTEPCA